jgi:hypothetical protein
MCAGRNTVLIVSQTSADVGSSDDVFHEGRDVGRRERFLQQDTKTTLDVYVIFFSIMEVVPLLYISRAFSECGHGVYEDLLDCYGLPWIAFSQRID